jgi:TonB family protein
MTAVMRAMSVARTIGPKVLRIAVVRGGRVLDERIIKQRCTVTVGSSETSMFAIPGTVLPPTFELFERSGEGYHLNVTHGMKVRIALPDGVRDLEGAQRLKLTDEARGKVVIGDTTLLFQFVAAPPLQPRPQLPLAVKGGLTAGNDWTLTFIAAFSFLFHFGLVGSMYSDWSDPIIGEGRDVVALLDTLPRIPPPPIEVPEQNATTTLPKVPTTASTQPPKPTDPPVKQAHNAPTERETTQTSNTKAAQLAARGEAMQMQIVAGLNGGPSVDGALKRSNAPPVDLTGVAERDIGVVRGTGDFKVTGGGTPVQQGNSSGLAGIVGGTKTDGTGAIAGKESAQHGPTGVAQIGMTNTTVTIPNADSVVAGLRGRFRTCYQTGLLGDSSMSGKVLISAKVGPNGEVTSADIASISGLSPEVGQCIAKVVKRATFSAPGGGGSTLQIPVTFVQQK